jgi:hypothetical protein
MTPPRRPPKSQCASGRLVVPSPHLSRPANRPGPPSAPPDPSTARLSRWPRGLPNPPEPAKPPRPPGGTARGQACPPPPKGYYFDLVSVHPERSGGHENEPLTA